jgi:hypothetical protein
MLAKILRLPLFRIFVTMHFRKMISCYLLSETFSVFSFSMISRYHSAILLSEDIFRTTFLLIGGFSTSVQDKISFVEYEYHKKEKENNVT